MDDRSKGVTPDGEQHSHMACVFHFTPKANRSAEANLAAFVKRCREELKTFSDDPMHPDWSWGHWKWEGVGAFTKLGTKTGPRLTMEPEKLLDASFIDFARAYLRYEHAHNPSKSPTKHNHRLVALRLLEQVLVARAGVAHPCDVDHEALDFAAQLARTTFTGSGPYNAGCELKALSGFLADKRMVCADVSSWKSPVAATTNLNRAIGKEAEAYRRKRLPDQEALWALAEIFSFDLKPEDPAHGRDIYTTAVAALLLSAPSRGQEVHDLVADLEVELPDKDGQLQYGLRFYASKGGGRDIKWIPQVMVPVAKKAVQRLKEMTQQARDLAVYIEEQAQAKKKTPNAAQRFYRHANCPDVPDDQPLSDEQIAQALGFGNVTALYPHGLSRANGVHTLDSLWQWVLKQQPKGFPWLSKEKAVKYSQALFCMFKNQLHSGRGTSAVILWAPTLATFNKETSPFKDDKLTIFQRHGYKKSDGTDWKLTSHQPRHHLNTEAQRFGMTQEEIAKWSGRAMMGQNRVYNHMTEFEMAERARKALGIGEEAQRTASSETPVQVVHWNVRLRPKPISCADLDLAPRGTNHITPWGACEHDFAWEPCAKFGQCLTCNEHHCIKSAGKDDQERLARIKDVLAEAQKEYEAAKQACEAGDYGADKWYESQSLYRDQLRELVSILEDKALPDGCVVRLKGGNNQTHLHRVLRVNAMKVLAQNTEPRQMIEEMLALLQDERPHAVVQAPQIAVEGRSSAPAATAPLRATTADATKERLASQ